MKVLILLVVSLSSFSCAQSHDPELRKKIGQILMIGFRGFSVEDTSRIKHDIEKFNIGSVVLFDYDVAMKKSERNIQSAAQVKKLTSQLQAISKTKLIISIDQEGGNIRRLKQKYGFPKTYSAQYLGELNNLDSTYQYSSQLAEVLNKAGINLNLAPVVDININPQNPVIGKLQRSFSSESVLVSAHAKAYIKAHHDNNVFTSLKHFPGHGSSKEDSHLGLTDISDSWSELELQPYQDLIEAGQVDAIMTAHVYNKNLDVNDPATLSKAVITDILRTQLKWNGIVISDDMMMGAITEHYGMKTAIEKALNAGVDILAFANNTKEFVPDIAEKAVLLIEELIAENKVSKEIIKRAFQRVQTFKERLN